MKSQEFKELFTIKCFFFLDTLSKQIIMTDIFFFFLRYTGYGEYKNSEIYRNR